MDFDMSEIAKAHTLVLQFKASQRFPSMLKNTLRTLVRSVFDIDKCNIDASRHFVLKYMKKWDWDFNDLKDAVKNAYKIDKAGNKKYEAYVRENGSKKIIFVYYSEFNTIFIITVSEGD